MPLIDYQNISSTYYSSLVSFNLVTGKQKRMFCLPVLHKVHLHLENNALG